MEEKTDWKRYIWEFVRDKEMFLYYAIIFYNQAVYFYGLGW